MSSTGDASKPASWAMDDVLDAWFKTNDGVNNWVSVRVAAGTSVGYAAAYNWLASADNRAKLGSFLKGRELREYQPEIDEALERKAELESKYNERRDNLPSALKKLTNGYEMRTYW